MELNKLKVYEIQMLSIENSQINCIQQPMFK